MSTGRMLKLKLKNMKITDKITITNEDNMELMARYPDKYFDLAIVDPPYGINMDSGDNSGKVGKYGSVHNKKEWDSSIPSKEYFNELFRVSKNQIIWGGNYFPLELTNSWIIWDKCQPAKNFSSCELAWSSTNERMNIFRFAFNIERNKIHPTQKPIALYKWILDKYAKEGDKILDTHLGSGSIAIACHDYGFELTACELDAEYYEKAVQRIKNHVSQQKLF